MLEDRPTSTTASLFVTSFISYIYFIQGFYLSLGASVALLYPVFPQHHVLSHLSLAFLPFSFKYLTAPLVQKFSLPSYGMRKLPIVLSLFSTTLLTPFLIRHLTDPSEYVYTVVVLFMILLFISMGDIALDAASVKELENPVLSSFLQMFFQSLGNVAGGLILLKLIKPSNWFFFRTSSPFCSPESIIVVISLVNGVVGLFLHFFYRQKRIKQQEQTPSFKKIYRFYLHFINPKFKLCRLVIYFICFNQGIKFFRLGFHPEAVHRGFDKDRLPELATLSLMVALAVNTIVSRYITHSNNWIMVRRVYLLELLFSIIVFVNDSFDSWIVFSATIILESLHLVSFLLNSTRVNTSGESALAGVCITTLASCLNLGNNAWLQMRVIGWIGYYPAVLGGLGIAVLVAGCSGLWFQWIQAGEDEQKLQIFQQKKD